MPIIALFRIFTSKNLFLEVARLLGVRPSVLLNEFKDSILGVISKRMDKLPTQRKKRLEKLLKTDLGASTAQAIKNKVIPKEIKKQIDDIINPKKNLSNIAEKLAKQTPEERKKDALDRVKENKAKTESVKLSSSWISRGVYTPFTGGAGELIIYTKKGKVGYSYPGVTEAVWTAMKKAKGKNGGGAGTVFWALYLRQFKSSTTYQFMKKLQKLTGVKGFQ